MPLLYVDLSKSAVVKDTNEAGESVSLLLPLRDQIYVYSVHFGLRGSSANPLQLHEEARYSRLG